MTYEDVVYRVQRVFEDADVRMIFEHVAFQLNIVGEAEGSFYIEIAGRQLCVEPYDYYDHDGMFFASAQIYCDLADRKYTILDAWKQGLLRYEGNEEKLFLCLRNLKLRD